MSKLYLNQISKIRFPNGEYNINRDICCCETMQPTIEANSYNSERIYSSPFIKTIISEDANYIFERNHNTIEDNGYLYWTD